jgi:hypothetical protein
MPQHDHVFDAEAAHGELDGRRRAMVPRIRRKLRRRHHRRHIAHGEELTGLGLGQNTGIDARIGAGHDQDLRRLAFRRQTIEQIEMLAVIAQMEIREAL